jgi:hypothetical protein
VEADQAGGDGPAHHASRDLVAGKYHLDPIRLEMQHAAHLLFLG